MQRSDTLPLGRTRVIALAAGFNGLMPMATDVYLIVMPEIARAFQASLAATHASMAMFALGFGIAHLFVGVLADRYGRRPVAIAGAVLFILATLAVTAAPTLEILTACRFVQGLVVATCPILGRALVRDALPPEQAAKAYAQVNALAALSPLTAPFLGAAAAAWGGWQAAMALLLVYGVVLVLAAVILLPETRPVMPEGVLPPTPLAAAHTILTNPQFLFGSAISMLLYSALFTWITTSPFLMMDQLGFTTSQAALVLGVGSLGYMAGSLVTARLSANHSPQRLIALGAPLMVAGALGALFALTRSAPNPLSTLVMVLPFYVGLGLTHASTLQIVMRPFPHMAGQASAWLGLLQQIGGVVVSMLAVRAGAGHIAIVVMIVCCLALLSVSAIGGRRLSR